MANPKPTKGGDDPFEWDVNRVVQELCTQSRTWEPTPNMKFPDPIDLEAKLRQNEYDGETLLAAPESDLWHDLGIRKAKLKLCIRTAIRRFKKRSPAFRKYESSLRDSSEDESDIKERHNFLSPSLSNAPTPRSAPQDGPVPTQAPGQELIHVLDHPPAEPTPPAELNTSAPVSSTETQEAARRPRSETSDTIEHGRKHKRRRLSMTALVPLESASTADVQAKFANLTEADRFENMLPESLSDLLERLHSEPSAYWGNGSLAVDHPVGFDSTADSDVEFAFVRSKRIGPAKTRWVNGRFKRYLLLPTSARQVEEELPIFGESDDDDNPEWDEILREQEDEDEEIRQEKAAAQVMQPDAVNDCIEGIIKGHIVQWQERKLPAQQRKAYTIWTQAGTRRDRVVRMVQLREPLRDETARLHAKVSNMKDNTYTRQKELEDLGSILEPEVFEIERLNWTINILKSPYAPERVSVAPAPRRDKPVAPKFSRSDGGMDIWSESEEDGLDDFIVDDEYGPLKYAVDRALPATSTLGVDHLALDASPTLPAGQSFSTNSNADVEMYDLTNIETSGDEVNLLSRPEAAKSKSEPKPRHGHLGDNLQLEVDYAIEKGIDYWLEYPQNNLYVLICLISMKQATRRQKILEAAVYSGSAQEFWTDQMMVAIKHQFNVANGIPELSSDKIQVAVATAIAQFFGAFTGELTEGDKLPKILDDACLDDDKLVTIQGRSELLMDILVEFWNVLRSLAPCFGVHPMEEDLLLGDQVMDVDDDGLPQSTKAMKAEADRLQLDENNGSQVNELRRAEFRKAQAAQIPEGSLVINEAKKPEQGIVYFPPHISERIRPHQIEGVRFMWDEITKDTHNGCLLAHTMGLGKTMQVITLLTALTTAACSDDETISSQVPEHLRNGKVVILCPAGLINNWQEELAYWTGPGQILGPIYSIVSGTMPQSMRHPTILKWADGPGPSILLIGYNLYTVLKSESTDIMHEKCSIVIADEAHRFKNEKGILRARVYSFQSTSRIALTGSPLSNNIEEYFAMIDWVSPGFLGPIKLFRSMFGTPIEDGLASNSSRAARRKARMLLVSLKKRVEPKVHRRSILALKGVLPPKKEYIIYLRLTDFQLAVYKQYLKNNRTGQGQVLTNSNVWALHSKMACLLAHPRVYHDNYVKSEVKDKNPTTRKPSPKADKDDDYALAPEVLSGSAKLFRDLGDYTPLELSWKMAALDTILDEALKMGEKVLIFSHRIMVLNFIQMYVLMPKNRRTIRIDGEAGTAGRQEEAKAFNTGNDQVCLISTLAGGVGLNLQGASRVVIMDFKYNPQNETQAIGRAYRIGQTKPVSIYWLIIDGTMEMEMQNSQIFKMQMASRVVDSKDPIAKSNKDLAKWFEEPRQVECSDTSQFRGQDSILDKILDLGGVASVVAGESYEEEDTEMLEPHEVEQALQMAAGTITHFSLPVDEAEPPQLPQPTVPQHNGQLGTPVAPVSYGNAGPPQTPSRVQAAQKSPLAQNGSEASSSPPAPQQGNQSAATPFAPTALETCFDEDDPSAAAMRSIAPPPRFTEPSGVSQPPMSIGTASPMASLGNPTPDAAVATAREDFEETLRKALDPSKNPSKRTLPATLVKYMEAAMNSSNIQGLQRRQAWNKLTKIVRTMPKHAEAMVDLAQPEFVKLLVTADKARVLSALEQGSTAQAQDV